MNEPLLGENNAAHIVNSQRAKNRDNFRYSASFALTCEVALSVTSTILLVIDISNYLCNK